MSNYFYGPALDYEVDYRRDTLRHEVELHRLARMARLATRAARAARRAPLDTSTAELRPETVEAGTSPQPVGSGEHPTARAA